MDILATPSIVDSGESICDFEYIRDSKSKSNKFSAFLQGTYAEPINTKQPEKLSHWFVPLRYVQAIEN